MTESFDADYEAIVAAVNGDMAAIGLILQQYSSLIDGEIYLFAPHLSQEVRKDCRQEVYIRLIRLILHEFKV